MTSEELYQQLHKRWTNQVNGFPILIDSPSFKDSLEELDDKQRILIAGGSGSGKSTLALRLVIDAISHALRNPSIADVFVIWNSLEVGIDEILVQVVQFLMYKKLGKTYTRKKLLNKAHESFDEQLDKDFKAIQKSLDAFLSKIRFVRLFTPLEFANYCTAILDDLHYVEIKQGKKIVGERKNPLMKVVLVSDTNDSYEGYDKYSKTEAVKRWNKYYTNKIFANTYKATMINVQQFSVDAQQAMYNNKGQLVIAKLIPNSQGLAEDRTSTRDHNYNYGIFSPQRFNVPEIDGIKTELFGNRLNFIYPIKMNFGAIGKGIPLLTNFNTLQYNEIPSPLTSPTLYEAFLKQHNLITSGVNLLQSPAKLQFQQLFNKENGNIELE